MLTISDNIVTRYISYLSLILILAGFSIDLAAGRWGAYIISPIPGLHLADLLLAMGTLAAAVHTRRLFVLPLPILVIFATTALYLVTRGFYALVLNPVPQPYLTIRDLAPFGYLVLAPFIALALRGLKPVSFIWVLRGVAAAHLLGFTLTNLGYITPFPSEYLGASFVKVFDYRGDLVGVILGIGFLAWGRWPGVAAGRVIQFLSILVVFSLESRATVLAFLFCLVLALWRESSWFPPRKAVIFVVAGLLANILLPNVPLIVPIFNQYVQLPTLDENPDAIHKVGLPPVVEPPDTTATVSPPIVEPLDTTATVRPPIVEPPDTTATVGPPIVEPPDTTATVGLPAIDKQLDQLGSEFNTGNARLLTWSQILSALPRDQLWLIGGGLGSDVLYRICSEGDGPTNSGFPGGGSDRPKCHVDSNEAPTVLRDPHNWLLNLMLYHGLIGTLIFILAIAIPMVVYRRTPCSSLAIIPIGAYFVSGSFGVILSAPFGMLPVAVFLGWLLREGLAPERPPTEQATQVPHV